VVLFPPAFPGRLFAALHLIRWTVEWRRGLGSEQCRSSFGSPRGTGLLNTLVTRYSLWTIQVHNLTSGSWFPASCHCSAVELTPAAILLGARDRVCIPTNRKLIVNLRWKIHQPTTILVRVPAHLHNHSKIPQVQPMALLPNTGTQNPKAVQLAGHKITRVILHRLADPAAGNPRWAGPTGRSQKRDRHS
jgi:hypothetical protein